VLDLGRIASGDGLRGGSLDRPSAIATFVSLLAADAGDVCASLGAVLGRPDLQIVYWLPDDERWVDRNGERQAVDLSQPGATVVAHRGNRVAALLLDPPLVARLDRAGPLMTAVGLALENERLQLALHARLEEQEALRRVATAVARQHEPEEVLALVASEVARHLGGDAALTARYDGHGLATVLAEWSAPGVGHFPRGRQITIGGPTALAQVQQTGAPARVDSYEGMPGDYPAELRELGMRAAVAAPIVVDGRLWGAVAAASVGAPFPPNAEARLNAFAELVAQGHRERRRRHQAQRVSRPHRPGRRRGASQDRARSPRRGPAAARLIGPVARHGGQDHRPRHRGGRAGVRQRAAHGAGRTA